MNSKLRFLMTPVVCILLCFAIFTSFARPAFAADTAAKSVTLKDPTAIYQAGEVQVEGLAFTETKNLNDFNSGGGLALTYWHWANVGAGLEAKTFDPDHAFFDKLGFNLAARYPVEKLRAALITRIGFDWNAEEVSRDRTRSEFDVYVGAGLEKRFGAYTLGAEVRGVRVAELQPHESLQFLVRAGRAF